MKADEVVLGFYAEGMSRLAQSGIFTFLREQGKIRPIPSGANNYAQLHIAESNRAIGYDQALQDLLRFKDTFLHESNRPIPPMDYGAVAKLLAEGVISKGEADELKRKFATGNNLG